MQKFALTAEISTKVAGGGLLFCVHPVYCTVYVVSFIRLADYLIVNMLHTLTVNSITTMLTVFTAQLQTTPSIVAIQKWTSVLDEIPEVPELGDKVCSLFDDLMRICISPYRIGLV